ncbi:hypothetical protein KHU50_005759 [Colletotrichum sp. SAR 10_65]|nr:hypothetical protein KHU50_005759 [Colletotrichum sp. SAR 10_65]KAI8204951.1 hypothetical protein K4K52_004665 [Colletotrichum sp. SAR 10_76]
MPKGRNYRLASEREDDRIDLPARLRSTARRRFNEAGEEIDPQGSQEVFATQTQQPDDNVGDESDVDDVAFGMDFGAGGDDDDLSDTSMANQGRTQDPDDESSDGDNSNVEGQYSRQYFVGSANIFEAAVDMDASDSEIEDAVKQGRHLPGVTMDDITAARDYEDARPMEEVAAFGEDLTGDEPLMVPPVTIEPLPTDPSVIQPHHQNQFMEMSDFEFAFGCLLHQYDINRPQYAGIVEVMSLLRAPGGEDEPLKEVSALPNQLATIKSRVSRRMPLIDMRKAEVPLNVEKLRTETATRKAEAAAAAARGEDPKPPTANLHIIDPVNLFKAVLSSDIAENQMHTGLAWFVDDPTELYHAHCWASSVRTTSGEFAHVANRKTKGLDPVFPSDFVLYCCVDDECVCQSASAKDPSMAHVGRIFSVGRDYRSQYCTEKSGDIVLQVQEAFGSVEERPAGMMPPHPLTPHHSNPPPICNLEENERFLSAEITFVPETRLLKPVNKHITCDYYWGETMSDPSPNPRTHGTKSTSYPKYEHQPETAERNMVVRQLYDGESNSMIPLCHTHPIRAELELSTYGREMFETWDKKRAAGIRIRSCPVLVFIDGFGIYRNSYRSLVGVYLIIAALNGLDRHRAANIFPITLSPHGSNFDDTIRALQSLGQLDKEVVMNINGVDTIVCVPTLCYIGDMPQQDKNSGFRGPKANKFCRFCFIGQTAVKSGKASDILDFDVVTHGRYHYQTMEMRKEMESKGTKTATKAFASQWGLGEGQLAPTLAQLSPALDLIMSRPPDPAHSEYQGMSELMHNTLLDRVLSESGRLAYNEKLRYWPMPVGWEGLQSPIRHLKSYSLAAHARWSIIIPCLLRSWLKPSHLHKLFLEEGQRRLGNDGAVIDFVVRSYATLAKSNSVLMSLKVSAEDRANVVGIIRATRLRYQMLCDIAGSAISQNKRAYSRFSREPSVVQPGDIYAAQSRDVSVAPGLSRADRDLLMMPPPPRPREETPVGQGQPMPKRAAQYEHDSRRPNVHIGIHYPQIMREYALPVNVNVLLGENQHRYFKRRVYETNFREVEKLLLQKVNMQMTMRLLLRNAFFFDDAELTLQMSRLYKSCPTLFDSILPRTDRREMALPQEEMDFEMDVEGLVSDEDHQRPSAIGQVSVRGVTHAINENKPLPTRPTTMEDTFTRRLRRAYTRDYGEPDIWVFSGRLQYSNKFAFSDRNHQRFVFSRQHYVKFRQGDDIGRVDHIFVNERNRRQYLFVVLTPVKITGERDMVLGLQKVEHLDDQPKIVGINNIQPARVYIVKIDEGNTVLVDWEVEWL